MAVAIRWLPLVFTMTLVAVTGHPVVTHGAEQPPSERSRAAQVRSAAPAAQGSELIERVLAVVAGRVITLTDVEGARALGLVEELSPFADPRRGALTELIERALVLAEVDRYAPAEPDEQLVTTALRRVREQFPSEEAFLAALDRAGFDQRRLREMARDRERIRAYLNQRFPGVPVGDEELRRYFEAHRDRFVPTASFEELRGLVVAMDLAEQRQVRIAEWVAGLRARVEVTDFLVIER